MKKLTFYKPEKLSENMFLPAYASRIQPIRSRKTPFVVMDKVAEGDIFKAAMEAARTLYSAILHKGAEIPVTDCAHCEAQRRKQMVQTMYDGKYTLSIHQKPNFNN